MMEILQDPNFWEALKLVAIIITALIADRLITRYLRHIAEFLNVSIGTLKGLRFFFRFIVLSFVLISLASIKWFPTEYFVGAGAIVATIIGFASATAISNFLSGAYVLVSRVIRIGDYVKIGDIEGIVVDMTVNYTKIKTPEGTIVLMSNKEIATKTIINYRREEGEKHYYIYPIEVSVPSKIDAKTMNKWLEQTQMREASIQGITIKKITRLDITYIITIKAYEPEAIPKVRNNILKYLTEKIASSQ